LKKLLDLSALLLFIGAASSGICQSVTTVEVYGPVTATQAYNGLGTNITPTNAWEYADAQAAHITWGRFDCSWGQAEVQNMPGNTSGGYKFPSACSAGLASSKTYGVHPLLNALYGPPYSAIAVGTAAAAVPVGATTVPLTLTSGSLSSLTPGTTFLAIANGYLASKYSYPGVLITGVSGSTVTLASKTTTALAQGATVTLNLTLYPPVIIAPGTSYLNNASVQAFGNYASYLAQQIAGSGTTGGVSVWNEPTWCCDKWDHGVDLYDTPPANGDISATLGVELPLYVSTMNNITGVPFDNGYTETAMWPGSLFYPATFANVQSLSSLQKQFGSESFHIYGNNPEDYIWNPACVLANATVALTSNILSGACTPIGAWTGATISAAVASQSYPNTAGGVKHSVTESGICRSCTGATETQVTRFDTRVFLAMQALGVSPVMFYRMSGETDWEWVAADQTPFPVYTAFKSLMTDIGTISQPPVSACPACSVPTVSSYKGYYPLATATLVGSRAGDSANSILYYTWQRSYGTKWTAVASPAAVPVTVSVPAGMTVTSVKDVVTSSAVTFTSSAGILSYQVADDPIEVLLTPVASTPPPSQQTIIFPSIASRAYGSAPFTVTASSSLGSSYPVTIVVQSGPAVISGSTVTLTGVGTVVLKATQPGDAQYSAATATQTFQVTPAPLTVLANNATRAYGAANPTFSGTVTGAVAGDSFTESFTTSASTYSSPGNYPVVPAVAGVNLANYAVTLVNGTLTVTGTVAVTTTTLTAPSSASQGTAVMLTAVVSSTSGTPTGSVSFYNGTALLGTSTLNSGTATLNTTALPAGANTVTATYAGSSSFSASTSSAVTIAITGPIPATQASYTVTANPTSLAIVSGKTANTTLILTPLGGYNGTIVLGCINLPSNMTCSFAQTQVSLSGNGQPASMSLTISVTPQMAEIPRSLPPLAFILWGPGGLTGMAAFASKRRFVKAHHYWQLCFLMISTLALAGCLSGCGYSGAAYSPSSSAQVTVLATGTSASAVTTQTVDLTIQTL
jgi:Bacterial Ig-like domain (group 3)/MBG domain (YGX type)